MNVTLPATQTYVENSNQEVSIHEFPMYAESSDNTLSFKNLCGALKLHLTANVSISTIAITAPSINGTFSVSLDAEGNPQLTPVSGSNTTILTCATAQSIASGKDFFIYLPAGNYSGLQIELNTDDGRYCVKTANTTISVTRSQYTLITLGESNLNFVEPLPEGSLPGLFTINSNGDQVRFSRGNLQYQASTDTWRFAEHQYDYVGGTIISGVAQGNVYDNGVQSSNALISPTYSGWIDLFGWGTGNNPTNTSVEMNGYNNFVDWGVNPILNGGNQPNMWRTPTADEWYYILNQRAGHDNLYAPATINGIRGLVVLPDGWVQPDNTHFNPISARDILSSANQTVVTANYNLNVYSLTEWNEMEKAGAVFLEGMSTSRIGTNLHYNEPYFVWIDFVPFCFYWTRTREYNYLWGEGWYTSNEYSYALQINEYIIAQHSSYPITSGSGSTLNIFGQCVRLIQDNN